MHGLYEGKMPFAGRDEIRSKELSLSAEIPEMCSSFLSSMLLKDELARPTANQVLKHPWLAQLEKNMEEVLSNASEAQRSNTSRRGSVASRCSRADSAASAQSYVDGLRPDLR